MAAHLTYALLVLLTFSLGITASYAQEEVNEEQVVETEVTETEVIETPSNETQTTETQSVEAQLQAIKPQVIEPRTTGIYGNATTLFQAPSPLLNAFREKKFVYPFYQYLDLSVVNPRYNVGSNFYLRGRKVFNGTQESLDVYNAFLDFSNDANTAQLRVGRIINTESVNFVLMDGAMASYKPIDGLELIAYGGYQKRNLQPDPEEPTDSFGIYGAKLKTDALLGSLITVGYEMYDPDDFSTRQFVNVTFNRVVPFTDYADIYGLAEIDVGEGNLGLLTAGVGITVLRNLYLNMEYDTYNIDKDRDEFRLDPIYDTIAEGRMQQAKAALTYVATSYLEVKGSYAFSNYDRPAGDSTNGNIARAGFDFDFRDRIGLRAFQGFYLIEGAGGNDYAVGTNTSLFEQITNSWQLEFAFAYAYYDKITNQDGNAFSYLIGSEYLIFRNLLLRTGMEFNTNPDFNKDVRVNLGLSYNFSVNP